MLPLPNQKRASRAAVTISPHSGDAAGSTGLTGRPTDRLSVRIRKAIRLADALYDEAVGCETSSFTEEQLDLLERRLAELRFTLEDPVRRSLGDSCSASPSPWSYDYSPYRRQDGFEIPAFEVYDANDEKVFDTNEESPCDVQEKNACLAAASPLLHHVLEECLRLLADSGDDGEVGQAYREGLAALAAADGRSL